MPPQSISQEEANMAIKASRIDVWMTVIDDRAGGAAEKLEALAGAGADLEVVLARRTPEHPGQGVLIASPLADSGINFRGMNAMVIGKNFLSFIAVDNADDAAKAVKALRKL